jgi:DNA-binding PadR family transcriptional regulator
MKYGAGEVGHTDYVVLGLLLDGPAHGYDLRRRAEETLGDLGHVAWSQMYSVLRRLERFGWIAASPREGGYGPPRRVVALTDAGEAAFWSWAQAPVTHPRDLRMGLLVRLAFLQRHRPGAVPDTIERQARVVRQTLDRVERPTSPDPDLGGWAAMVRGFRASLLRGTLQWLEETSQALARREKGVT